MAINFRNQYVKQKLSLVTYWLVALFTLASGTLQANSNSYQIEEISQLGHHQISDKNWQQIIANPSNKEQFFVINSSGQLYLLEDIIAETPLLDINSTRTENNGQEESAPIYKLTAIALHPNFSLRDQKGYSTFYTAHLETTNKKSRTKRIQERSSDLTLTLDAVITEWKFTSAAHKKVDISSAREVLRIGVPDESFVIEQMSFNPATKSWNDDFGLLYISLTGDKKWQKPLYSGVILRINPNKFGLRSFTVPNSNPFLKDSQIKDSIYLLGGQSIQQFIWPDKNSEKLLIVHRYNQQTLLSLTTGRDDWRVTAPKKILHQSKGAINDVVMYRGRNLPYLRNKLLLLSFKEQNWQIESLMFNRSVILSENKVHTPQLEWQFTHRLSTNSEPSMAANFYDEIIVLENNENLLFRLSQDNVEVTENVAPEIDENSQAGISFIVLLFSGVAAAALYYLFKVNKFSAKKLVRQQYAHLEISESEQQIGLYYRHERSADTILDIVDIASSEVLLNEHAINCINDGEGHGFSNDKEQDMRDLFHKEHIDKMVDGKIRQITLRLTTKEDKSYLVCLYMRKGSNRITKKSYFNVVDELINWCWLIAHNININETGERKAKPVIKAATIEEQMLEKEQNATPLHNQAAAIRPVKNTTISPKPKTVIAENPTTEVTTEELSKVIPATKNEVSKNKSTNSTIDTELVNALEKLVNLKQQGFLSADEFAQAKEKLLQNLFDKQ